MHVKESDSGSHASLSTNGLMCTPLSEENEIQEKYNISNRRALRALLRSPIYGANEATEMELGIKKISQLNKRNTLNMIGKVMLEENSLHTRIAKKAISL